MKRIIPILMALLLLSGCATQSAKKTYRQITMEEAVTMLEEETGYRCEKLEYLMSLNTTVAFCDERIEVFVARNLIPGEQHLDEDEFVDVKAYKLEELKEMIFEGKIEDSKTVAAILAYDAKYNR